MKPPPDLLQLARLFQLLSDPSRLRILLELRQETSNVSELCRKLKLAQPTVSHHLAILRMASLVEANRRGKEVFYSPCKIRQGKAAALVKSLLK